MVEARRLENIAWRQWGKQQLMAQQSSSEPPKFPKEASVTSLLDTGVTPEAALRAMNNIPNIADKVSSSSLARLDKSLEGTVDLSKKFLEEFVVPEARETDEGDKKAVAAAAALQALATQETWTPQTTQAVLDFLSKHDAKFGGHNVPDKLPELTAVAGTAKPTGSYAVFSHSLERNGANNFIMFLLSELATHETFELVSPSDGPMKADFENIGVSVTVMSPKEDDYLLTLGQYLKEGKSKFRALLCNTIMRAEVVVEAAKIGIPTIWVIHEAWPPEQFVYYAKEVFLMKHVDPNLIRNAFDQSTTIVFPAGVQRDIYKDILVPGKAKVIYNGVPLGGINLFRATQNRDEIRKSMGYTKEDFVVLHLGTVCKRKSQLSTAKAFADLCHAGVGDGNLKLLMVGARYIREHEIAYIEEIKGTASAVGLECLQVASMDALKEQVVTRGGKAAPFALMDIQKDVLPFYMSADVIVVPSINEVLPLVICEAMAFERPVVASRIDGIPEAITDGEEGILIKAGDPDELGAAIAKLNGDPDLRVRMGTKGRTRVLTQFSFQTMSKHYNEAFSNIEVEPQAMPAPTVVLCDIDNTIVDFDKEFLKRWKVQCPQYAEHEPTLLTRTKFHLDENLPEEYRAHAVTVMASPGFYESLEPLPGAVEALKAMVEAGLDVRLVTTPYHVTPGKVAEEKYVWVKQHLGEDFVHRLNLCMDKTHIAGTYLIDDKPMVIGSNHAPTWEHIVFDRPYNRGPECASKRRLPDWGQWESLLRR